MMGVKGQRPTAATADGKGEKRGPVPTEYRLKKIVRPSSAAMDIVSVHMAPSAAAYSNLCAVLSASQVVPVFLAQNNSKAERL